jgi:RNA polymerase sigma-70 factor (ECF subfamily)
MMSREAELLAGGPPAVAAAGPPDDVAAVLDGWRDAAEALWSRQAPRLVRAAIALGVPAADAGDVVQEALLAAFRRLRGFDPARGSFDAWTHAILVRRCANWRRARARLLRALRGAPRQEPPSRPDGDLDARRTLERLVGGLAPARRRAWALVEISGLSPREAASILRVRESTVRSHLRHAREAMRRAAEEER